MIDALLLGIALTNIRSELHEQKKLDLLTSCNTDDHDDHELNPKIAARIDQDDAVLVSRADLELVVRAAAAREQIVGVVLPSVRVRVRVSGERPATRGYRQRLTA